MFKDMKKVFWSAALAILTSIILVPFGVAQGKIEGTYNSKT
ncbi:MAG: hypothetical protein RL062_982, partial [Bacteroidota bacterium]